MVGISSSIKGSGEDVVVDPKSNHKQKIPAYVKSIRECQKIWIALERSMVSYSVLDIQIREKQNPEKGPTCSQKPSVHNSNLKQMFLIRIVCVVVVF